MKVVITGDANINNYPFIKNCIKESIQLGEFEISRVFHGDGSGVDSSSMMWAWYNGVETEEFCSSPKNVFEMVSQNKKIVEEVDILIVICRGDNPRIKNLIGLAQKAKLRIFVWENVWTVTELCKSEKILSEIALK